MNYQTDYPHLKFKEELIKKCIDQCMVIDQFKSILIGRKVDRVGLCMDTGPVLYF